MTGWNEKILDIDLTTQTYKTYPLDMEMARLFIGGRGMGARLLWDMVGPEVDPLSPENVLIFTNGPLTATGYQTSNRFSVTTKSPLTGTVLDANSGGFWGMQFKKAGYDVMIVRGKAEKPIWIEIKNEVITFHDASELWGMRVFALTEKLGQNNNKRNVLCIGPAGENLSRIAAIMNDRERAMARGGPGAVMGSKNLKAIVVEGKNRTEIEDKDRFKFLLYETRKLLAASPLTSQALPEFGTVVLMNIMNNIGALATRNHQQTQFEGAEAISGEELTEKYLVKNQSCWACPIGCTRISKTEKVEGEGPEFEIDLGLRGAMRHRRPARHHRSQHHLQRSGNGYHFGRIDDCLRHGTERKRLHGFRPALRTRRSACPHVRSDGGPTGCRRRSG